MLEIASVMESYITDGEFALAFPDVALESVWPYNGDGIATEASSVATWVSNAYRMLQVLRNKLQMFIAQKLMHVNTLLVYDSFRKTATAAVAKAYNGSLTADDVAGIRTALSEWKEKGKQAHLVTMTISEGKKMISDLMRAIDATKQKLASVKSDYSKDDVGRSGQKEIKGVRRDDIIALNGAVSAIVSGMSAGISGGRDAVKQNNAEKEISKTESKDAKAKTAQRKKDAAAAFKEADKEAKAAKKAAK